MPTVNLPGFNRSSEQNKLSTLLELSNSSRELDLSNQSINFEDMEKVSDKLNTNKGLRTLKLDNCKIDDKAAKVLAKSLKNNTTLSTLSLKDNQISDKGITKLASALQGNKILHDLDVSGNLFTSAGTLSLSKLIKTNTALTGLYLDSNNIDNEGAKFISEALNESTLQQLHMNNNNIDDHGVQFIAQSVKNNVHLNHLQLAGNKIGDNGAKYIADMLSMQWYDFILLKKTSALHSLSLENNQIGDVGAKHIIKALEHNKVLKQIHLENNQIGHSSIGDLDKSINKLPCQLYTADQREVVYSQLMTAFIQQETELATSNTKLEYAKISATMLAMYKIFDWGKKLADAMAANFHPHTPDVENIGQELVVYNQRVDYNHNTISLSEKLLDALHKPTSKVLLIVISTLLAKKAFDNLYEFLTNHNNDDAHNTEMKLTGQTANQNNESYDDL